MTDRPDFDERYKVGRVLAAYGLDDLHEQLPDLWLGENGQTLSLRELARRINIRLVRAELEQAGEDPLDGEAENTYRLLTSDDVSVGVRTQQRNRLERTGVDVDELEDNFVTHQAVYTYLTNGLGVSKEDREEVDRVEKHEARLQRLRSRLDAVLEQSLDELESSGDLTLGRVDTTVSVQIYCRDCETQYDITQLFDADGCDCARQDGSTD